MTLLQRVLDEATRRPLCTHCLDRWALPGLQLCNRCADWLQSRQVTMFYKREEVVRPAATGDQRT